MAQDANNLVWLDMEMTGLEPERERIIELAMIVTDSNLETIAESPVWVLHQSDAQLDAMDADVLSLDAALDKLAELDARLAKIVEWRYFGGMSETEIAAMLDVTERTVRREWRKARAFLYREMGGGEIDGDAAT